MKNVPILWKQHCVFVPIFKTSRHNQRRHVITRMGENNFWILIYSFYFCIQNSCGFTFACHDVIIEMHIRCCGGWAMKVMKYVDIAHDSASRVCGIALLHFPNEHRTSPMDSRKIDDVINKDRSAVDSLNYWLFTQLCLALKPQCRYSSFVNRTTHFSW